MQTCAQPVAEVAGKSKDRAEDLEGETGKDLCTGAMFAWKLN